MALTPTFSDAEKLSLEFSISPSFPTGLDIAPTGLFGGRITEQPGLIPLKDTKFTITVKNAIGNTVSSDFYLSISDAPDSLAYTQQLILEVDNNSLFDVGDFITSAPIPPDNVSAVGIVKSKMIADAAFGDNYIVVSLILGVFKEGDGLDNVNFY